MVAKYDQNEANDVRTIDVNEVVFSSRIALNHTRGQYIPPPIMLVEGFTGTCIVFSFVFVLVSCKLRNQGDTKRKQNVSEHMRDPRMGRPQDEIEVTA